MPAAPFTINKKLPLITFHFIPRLWEQGNITAPFGELLKWCFVCTGSVSTLLLPGFLWVNSQEFPSAWHRNNTVYGLHRARDRWQRFCPKRRVSIGLVDPCWLCGLWGYPMQGRELDVMDPCGSFPPLLWFCDSFCLTSQHIEREDETRISACSREHRRLRCSQTSLRVQRNLSAFKIWYLGQQKATTTWTSACARLFPWVPIRSRGSSVCPALSEVDTACPGTLRGDHTYP